MKKRIIAAVGALLFAALLILSVIIPSWDNLSNAEDGLKNIKITLSEENMHNFDYSDGVYTSREDSQIVLSGLSCYVNAVRLPAELGSDPVKVYYTDGEGEQFSEEKSFEACCEIKGSSTYIEIGREVGSLRLDIAEEAGISLRMRSIEINDRGVIISLGAIFKYCVFPLLIIGLIVLPLLYLKEIKPYALKLKKYIPLLKNLVSRDLKVKYRRSVLGFVWSVLNPILMALVLNAVFSRLFRFDIEYFAVYYLTGSLIFNFVIECTTGSMTSIIDSASLIKKVYIPKYIFPLEKCCFAFINMLFSSVAVIVIMLIQGAPFSFTALLFPIPMIYAFLFAYGFSLVLSSMMVFFRDMQHLWSVWTAIWMYLTPIIYPAKLLSDNGLGFVMKANPMYYYTTYLREIVMYGNLPSLDFNIICMVFAGLMMVLGVFVFNKAQDKFILYI